MLCRELMMLRCEALMVVLTCNLRQYFTPEIQEGEDQKRENVAPATTKEAESGETDETTTGADAASTIEPTKPAVAAQDEPKFSTEQTDHASEAAPSSKLPDLPDVPTKEPALPDEPEVKKLKLSQ